MAPLFVALLSLTALAQDRPDPPSTVMSFQGWEAHGGYGVEGPELNTGVRFYLGEDRAFAELQFRELWPRPDQGEFSLAVYAPPIWAIGEDFFGFELQAGPTSVRTQGHVRICDIIATLDLGAGAAIPWSPDEPVRPTASAVGYLELGTLLDGSIGLHGEVDWEQGESVTAWGGLRVEVWWRTQDVPWAI